MLAYGYRVTDQEVAKLVLCGTFEKHGVSVFVDGDVPEFVKKAVLECKTAMSKTSDILEKSDILGSYAMYLCEHGDEYFEELDMANSIEEDIQIFTDCENDSAIVGILLHSGSTVSSEFAFKNDAALAAIPENVTAFLSDVKETLKKMSNPKYHCFND